MFEASKSDVELIVAKIRKSASRADSEATLQTDVEHILRSYFEKVGLEYEPQHNITVIKGRPDTLYGRVILEYKIPGTLKSAKKAESAIQEAQKNILEIATKNKEDSAKYVGIVLDGEQMTFTKSRRGKWITDPLVEVGSEAIQRLLEYIRGLARKPLHPDLMVKQFGPESDTARHVVALLYDSVIHSKHPRTNVLFQQWKKTFSQVCGYDFKSPKLEVKALVGKYKVGTKKTDFLMLLFAIHTYFALLIKLLAAEITVTYASRFNRSFLEELLLASSEGMKSKITELEQGETFAVSGIKNFLEGDYFSWYLDVWGDKIRDITRNIAQKLANYEPATATLEPDQVKDLLKRLYQYLVPKKIRHDLGEFFTPDWLAEALLDETGYQGDPNKRVLDPSCGSGTFLVLAIKRIREFAQDKMIARSQTLELILDNVIGFDLNPLAVIASRTNYLIALGDLVGSRPRGQDIRIPVYLCDSISVSGTETPSGKKYHVSTAVGKFNVPEEVVQEALLDEVSTIAVDSISEDYKSAEFVGRISTRFPKLGKAVLTDLKVLYEQLLVLEKKRVNKIWASVIKNAFAPLFCGKFDFVVGNPPWVNWESLPEDYRQESKPIWDEYGLLAQTEGRALGKTKRDIAMLFVARSVERFLKEDGTLAFLLTFTLFKNHAGAGFRSFLVGKCRVLPIHNMVRLRPFEGAVNRTALLRVTRGRTSFPVRGVTWLKTTPGFVDPSETLENLLKETQQIETVVRPVDGRPGSPWMMTPPIIDAISKKFLGESEYRAHAGIFAGLNGVYWVRILEGDSSGLLVQNLAGEGKTDLKTVSAVVDPEFAYPLVRGRDVEKWMARPSNYWVLPVDREGKLIDEPMLKERYSKTYAYFHKFSSSLQDRKAEPYKTKVGKGEEPFYWLFNVRRALHPYKVVWKEIAGAITGTGEFACAVLKPGRDKLLGSRPLVPDHKLMFVPTETEDEAYYLAAVLNSTPVRLIVGGYTIETHISTGVTQTIRIPTYQGSNLQKKLAKLARRAEEAVSNGDVKGLQSLEEQVDESVGDLYSLRSEDVSLIRELAIEEASEEPRDDDQA